MKVSEQQQLFDPGLYPEFNIVPIPHDGYHHAPHGGNDYPYLYHAPSKTLYIGPKEWYHIDMLEAGNLDDLRHRYMADLGNEDYGFTGRMNDQGENAYGNSTFAYITKNFHPDLVKRVENAVRDQIGAPTPFEQEPEDEDELWKYANSNRIIHHESPHAFKFPMHDWRVPVVYDKDEDRFYVGQPAGEHSDLMKNFDKDNPWQGFPDHTNIGYIDTEGHLDTGAGLHWNSDPSEIPNLKELEDWVENKYGVKSSPDVPKLYQAIDDDLWANV